MTASCAMMRRPARPNGRPQRVRSHPMCLWCAVACSTSWREFQRDRRCFGHTTPRASRCRCPGLEQDGGWRSGGGERRGRGSINALTGFLSSAVTWPTSFAGSFALLPTNWWLSRSELSLIFLADPRPRVPLRFIHTSVPDRGLVHLLREVFPPLRHLLPASELHVYSYRPLDPYTRYSTPGVHFHGWVPKPELVRALGESTLMLYPANAEEMGCIAVLESMAAGTPAVTSSLGVLPELAGDGSCGVVVEGWPGTREFSGRSVEARMNLLADPDRLERMRVAAREYAITRHNWEAIAVRWQEMLRATLDDANNKKQG